MLWLKFIHVGGIAIWIAGLVALAALLARHREVRGGQDFVRLHLASRFAYMGLASPAAFLAVAAGTGLLFVSDALHPWMFAKLAAVAVLVMVHVRYADVLTRLADPDVRDPNPSLAVLVAATFTAVLAVLYLVLAKPVLGSDLLPEWLSRPGYLSGAAHPAAAPPAWEPDRRQ